MQKRKHHDRVDMTRELLPGLPLVRDHIFAPVYICVEGFIYVRAQTSIGGSWYKTERSNSIVYAISLRTLI